MSRLSSVLAAILASAAANAVLADSFTYIDHWPSGTGDETATEVLVPDGTTATIATADDVSRVERLTAVSFGGGAAKVCYTASAALDLSASVSGPGKFLAESAGSLTLRGDNSGLTGSFSITNTPLLVGSRYGLGGSSTEAAYFHYGTAGTFDFLWADDVMTNDVPITVECLTSASNQIFGPSDSSKTLVQRNDFYVKTGGGKNYLYFRGTVVYDGGTFGTLSGHMYSSASGATAPHAYFTDNVAISIKNGSWYALGTETLHFAAFTKSSFNYLAVNVSTKVVCESVGALSGLTTGVGLYPKPSGANYVGRLDLNGLDQTIQNLKTQGDNYNKENGGRWCAIHSDSPAVLTMEGSEGRLMPFLFSGEVSLCHDSACADVLINYKSTSTGDLFVPKGALEFRWNAGWSGTNVVVGGGTLFVNSPVAFDGGDAALVVTNTGRLRVSLTAGQKGAYFASARFGDVRLGAGASYTMAELKAMDGVGGYIDASSDDDAVLTVAASGESEWAGWPEDGGSVSIPAATDVGIGDADVVRVARLTDLTIGVGSTVYCTNGTLPLVLAARVSGFGTFDISSSAGVTLAGDNSGLLSPGHFAASGTVVNVTHRYGAGGAGTAAFESIGGDLVFSGAGLTNDAPITYSILPPATTRMFGAREGRGPFVQRGNFAWKAPTTAQRTVFTNDVVFAAGCRFGPVSSASTFYMLANKSTLAAESGSVMSCQNEVSRVSFYFLSSVVAADNIYDFSCDVFAAGVHMHQGTFRSGRADLFGPVFCRDGVYIYSTTSNGYAWDLDGVDQTVAWLRNQEASSTVSGQSHIGVKSESPAVLTIVGAQNQQTNVVEFSGAVSLSYAATNAVYTLFGRPSTSTGALTIEAGSFELAGGATWAGTNVVVSGGTLSVLSGSSSPFTAVDSRNRAAADLSVSGAGELYLAAGVTAKVRTANHSGDYLEAKTYTGGSFQWLRGEGSLVVRRSGPTAGGIIVIR